MSTIEVLRDGEALSGQAYSAISIIGPGARQSAKVFGLKVYGHAEDIDEARKLAKYFNQQNPAFDVYVVENNKWLPLEFSPDDIKEQKFGDRLLTEMLEKRKEEHHRSVSEWDRQLQERREAIKRDHTAEGQRALLNAKENAVAVRHKIKQAEANYRQWKDELDGLYRRYHSDYTDEERKAADALPMPSSEPLPVHYDLYSSA